MEKKTKISLIAIAVILVLIAGVFAVNFLLYPVSSTYENEDGETRVKIGGEIYKPMPDMGWQMDSETGRRIGYLDNINTTLYEYKGDSTRDAVFVYAPSENGQSYTLIKEDIELGSVEQQNVYKIMFDDPQINELLNIIFNSNYQTQDEAVIAEFFEALGNSSAGLVLDETAQEALDKAFVLKCYNKNLNGAAAVYQVYIYEGQYLCTDEAEQVYTVIPAEVFTDITGGEFDAGLLLGE